MKLSIAQPGQINDPAVFEAALEAFRIRLIKAGQKDESARSAVNSLKRVAKALKSPIFSAAEVEAWGASRITAGIKRATLRQEQIWIEQFCDFLLDPHYQWKQKFKEAYKSFPEQPIHHANRIMHIGEDESEEHVRAITWDELRAFFARCDFMAKNASTKRERRVALRDGNMFKTGSANALRDLEMADVRRSQCKPVDGGPFGDYGSIRVLGKSKSYGPKRPRTIYANGYFPWSAPVLDFHVREVMPLFPNGDGDRLFATEGGEELDPGYVSKRFSDIRDDAGLPKAVTAHGMRRLWATTLAIAGVDTWYISDQLGHESIVTTMRYILIPEDFKTRIIRELQGDLLVK